MRSMSVSFVVFALFSHLTVALKVTPGSGCAVLCLDNPESDPNDPRSSSTTPDNIVCADDDYNTAPAGIKFQNCLECLQTSNATSGSESDASWFLHNIRYSVDVCLYDFPAQSRSKSISSPCDTSYACEPLKTALEAGIKNLTSDTYEYCSADGGTFGGPNADACVQCLQSSPDQAYLANFVTALMAGCQQKPEPGVLIGLSGSVFTNAPVNITSPLVSPLSTSGDSSSSMFTTGAIAGIAIGAALLFLGGSGLFYVYYRRQKRLYADTKNVSSHNPWDNGGSMEQKVATPQRYELRTQTTHTAGYYGQRSNETQNGHLGHAIDPNGPQVVSHGILPKHPAYIPTAHSRPASGGSEARVKSNRPDSFAVQAYLNAAQEANMRGIASPPAATVHSSAFQMHASGLAYDTYSKHTSASQSRASSLEGRGPSLDSQPLFNPKPSQNHRPIQYIPKNQQQLTPQNQNFNLPPPPRTSKVPYLSFPSLPKLRVPKRYVPPTITFQGATPTDEIVSPTQEGLPIGHHTSAFQAGGEYYNERII